MTEILANWMSENFVDRPTLMKSPTDCIAFYTKKFAPLTSQVSNSVERDTNIRTPISGLLSWRGPLTIFFKIAFIVIFAINSGSYKWNVSHVLIECQKGFSPTATYGYTPSSIDGIIKTIYVFATLNHTHPCIMNWGMGHTMNEGLFSCYFFEIASTTCRVMTFSEMVLIDTNYSTAITLAQPFSTKSTRRISSRQTLILFNYCKATNSLPYKIYLAGSSVASYDAVRHGFCSNQRSRLEQSSRPNTERLFAFISHNPYDVNLLFRKVA